MATMPMVFGSTPTLLADFYFVFSHYFFSGLVGVTFRG